MNIITSALLAACAALPLSADAIGRLSNLSIYDRTENRTLPVYWHEGQAWVVGKPGNEYQVSVRNPSGSDVLAVVSVDGVNVITGETASPHQTGYIIDGWRNVNVNGWRKDLSRTAAFYFTTLPDSYAARTGRPDNVGVIGVAVFRRKPEPPPPAVARDAMPLSGFSQREKAQYVPSAPAPAAPATPLAEAAPQATQRSDVQGNIQGNTQGSVDLAKRESRNESPRLGTGHGRSEYSRVRMVDFERATPHPEEMVTIRYDSYANLVARGVIVARAPERIPNAFPQTFVPDPPRS